MNESDEINFIEYFSVLLKYRKMIALFVAFTFVLSVVVSFTMPITYTSEASIMPPNQGNDVSAILSAQLPGGIGGLASSFLGGGSSVDLWVGMLNSKTVTDAIIERFDLRTASKVKTMDEMRYILKKMVKVSKSKEGIITISVEDKDPVRAAQIANAYTEELDRLNRKMITTSGKRTRVFIEERLKQAEADLTRTEDALKKFQEKHKAVKLDEQSKQIIEAIGTIKGQVMAKEVEYKTLLSYVTPENPQAQVLKTQVDELKTKLSELEYGEAGRGDVFIPSNMFPNLTMQYMRLLRDAKVQETLFEILTKQSELARIEEAKDTPTVQILDSAKPADKRTGPKRTRMVLVSVFASFVIGIFMAFVLEFFEGFRKPSLQL